MAGSAEKIDFEKEDVSPLAAEGHNHSVDDDTIFNTPNPVAASTVGKTDKGKKYRYTDGNNVQGSFIETTSADELEISTIQDELPKMHISTSGFTGKRESHLPLPVQESEKLESEGSRSSLGLVMLDNMDDLSASVLNFDPNSPHKTPSVLRNLGNVEIDLDTPKMAQLSSATLTERTGNSYMQYPSSEDAAELDMECMMRKKSKLPTKRVYSTDSSNQVLAVAFAQITRGVAGLEQMDSSLHDIEIDDEEIKNLDEEFSDIGDFDNTVTHSDEVEVRDKAMDQPGDDLLESNNVFAHATAPPDLASLDYLAETIASFDELDSLPHDDAPVSKPIAVSYDHSAEVNFEERRRCVGEGLESRTGITQVPHVLNNLAIHNAQYAARQERTNLNQIADRDSGGSTTFQHLDQTDGKGRRRENTYCNNDWSGSPSISDMDTDDELEAVRREMRQNIFEDIDDFEMQPSVRQGAEGDVGSPSIPGDGGGGGDGSSGHDSDDNGLAVQLPPRSAQNGPTTFEVLRGLGFLGVGSSASGQNGESLEAEERMRPMGEELDDREQSESSEASSGGRRVRFVCLPSDSPDRNLSGASINDSHLDQDLSEGMIALNHGQVSMSKFLTPSNPLDGHNQSEDFDESLFPDTVQEGNTLQQRDGIKGPSPSPEGDQTSVLAHGNLNSSIAESSLQQHILEGSEGFGSQEFQAIMADGAFGEEFLSSDKGHAMLDKDEDDFKTEGVFIQEEEMDSATHSSLDLPDNWSLHSHMTFSNRPSWMTNTAGSTDTPNNLRISIGTFMAGRTEALGSLEDESDFRPTFGAKIITPPDNRKPVALIRHSPSASSPVSRQSPHAPRLSDVTEKKESITTTENMNTTNCTSSDDVRGSGVGSDIKEEASNTPERQHRSLSFSSHTAPELDGDQRLQSVKQSDVDIPAKGPVHGKYMYPNDQQANDGSDNYGFKHFLPEALDQYNDKRDTDSYQLHCPHHSAESTLSQSGVLQLSAITKAINSASVNADSASLAELIMQMSQTNKTSKENIETLRDLANIKQRRPADGTCHIKEDCKLLRKTANSHTISDPSHKRSQSLTCAKKQSTAHNERSRSTSNVSHNSDTQSVTEPKSPKSENYKPSKCRRPHSTRRSRIPSLDRGQKQTGVTMSYTPIKGNIIDNANQRLQDDAGLKSRIPLFHQKTCGSVNNFSKSPVESADVQKPMSLQQKNNCTPPPQMRNIQGLATSGSNEKLDYQKDMERSNSMIRSPVWKSPRPSSVSARSHSRQNTHSNQLRTLSEHETEHGKRDNYITKKLSVGSSPTESLHVGRHNDKERNPRVLVDRINIDRMSSTPKVSAPHVSICNSQDSLSRISQSPRDPCVADSTDATIWSEKGTVADEPTRKYNSVQQETPKGKGLPFFKRCSSEEEVARGPYDEEDATKDEFVLKRSPIENPKDDDRNELHTQSLPKPALLTSHPLSTTSFPQLHLNTAKSVSTSTSHHHIHTAMDGNKLPDKSPSSHTPTDGFDDSVSSVNFGVHHSESLYGSLERPIAVSAPHEVRMDNICCLGLSTQGTLPITNSTNRWLDVRLIIHSLALDGRSLDPSRLHPFITKEKAIIDPGNTEEVKIIFNPKESGTYVANVQLLASPVVTEQRFREAHVPTMVTLQGIAERPNVQILTDANQHVMDFGALPWGCQKGLPITIINRGRASVPIRLAISCNKSTLNCFTFERGTMSDPALQVIKSWPQFISQGQSLLNITLSGIGESQDIKAAQVVVYFKAPSRQSERDVLNHPKEFAGRIDFEVDTPSSVVHLGTTHLCAAVGTASLHAPSDLQMLNMKASVGTTVSRSIPLRNAGNIPLEVSLEVTHWPDFFEVIPSRLIIEPKGQAEVMVKFDPKQSSANIFESLLLMFVEPDGPGYEIQILGEIATQISMPTIPFSTEPVLLSNKHYLAWGGVAIERGRQKSLTLRNNTNQALTLNLTVKGNSSDFKIQSNLNGLQHLSNTKDIVIHGQDEYAVNIMFTPSMTAEMSAKLLIRPSQMNSKYTIPLTGYGGLSKLVLDQVNPGQQKNNYWTSIGTPRLNSKVVSKFTVRNTGKRAAFVKTLSFHDMACKRKMDSSKITIQPSEFCVRANEMQELALVFSISESESVICQEKAAIVAVIGLFYGDEVSRQKLIKSIRHIGKLSVSLPESNPMKGAKFDEPYEDEDLVLDGSKIECGPCDQELFFSSMSKLTISLVGEPRSRAKNSFDEGLNYGSRHQALNSSPLPGKASWEIVTNEVNCGLSPPVKETEVSDSKPGPLGVESNGLEWWTVRPGQLILVNPEKATQPIVKRVQITNFSDRQISYELSWPAHCVTVTPERGFVAARSNTIFCISSNSSLRKKGIQLPWSGIVHVTCDGELKAVRVQIRDDAINETSGMACSSRKQYLSLDHVSQCDQEMPIRLKVSDGIKHFVSTPVNKTSEQFFELTNVCCQPLTWTVSSVDSPCLKENENSRNIQHVSHSVFWFQHKSGTLAPFSTGKVKVWFSPHELGHFNQHWEIVSKLDDPGIGEPMKHQVELFGKCISNLHNKLPRTDYTNLSRSDSWNKSGDGLLQVKPKELQFPGCRMDQSHICKIELKNKDSHPHTVEVLTLQPPFRVKHTSVTIKRRHYLRLPVEFCPKNFGKYENVLVLKSDTQQTITIPLHGECIQ